LSSKVSEGKFPLFLQKLVEWYKNKKLLKLEKAKKKHPVVEWIEAILWALVIVLLIQQFLFELYVIPTGSMIPTVEIGSRIAVEKITFGPELIPGKIKLNGIRSPKRGEIIMFENPSYPPMTPILNILHKIIYRLTLTLVDIDKDQYGNPRPRLLLKRVIAIAGDKIRVIDGDVEIMPAGETQWLPEEDLKAKLGIHYVIQRDYKYPRMHPNNDTGETTPQNIQEWDIPANSFFPMGDNRDHSRDAREYGPVSTKRLLGKAFFRLWPTNKFGFIK